MQNQTLYLIQSNYNHTKATLDKLESIFAPSDAVLLMGDTVLFSQHPFLDHPETVYILENDAEILVGELPSHFKTINYSAFADLILQFTRCVSLK
ncbi:DsrH/TusB family sulfur metabolism protein [Acinetobacter stercoris]|uniref:Sulfurtransferase complex subunit TusB n=1 Tax=Acinetobacter stercoris TaxID=2126983 RepID=A0A2U3MWW5_9GAMM|nr:MULTISPECIES: DsrH/TusB family sulfur metabolism protein [Acinetobacter]SPL69927.1 hypothetical protein KPC_1105 [Acinetobacter stercoris]